MQRKLAFIGPMGCGKSTVADAYAAVHNKSVFDTDKVFTSRYGSINAFFGGYGENEFRKIEKELVIEAVDSKCDIIACGGGAVLEKSNMNALRAHCDIVYIEVDISVLESRIANSDRPLKSELKSIIAARRRLYEGYADHIVNGNGTVEAVVKELDEKLRAPRKNRYNVLLCDADDTVLDFKRAMRFAVVNAAKDVGVKADGATVVNEYQKILPVVWGKLERGEITRDMLVSMRFNMLKTALGEEFDIDKFNDAYTFNIKKTRFVRDGALEFLSKVLSRGIKVYIITNSYRSIADERLKALEGYTDGAFVSENIGFDKPDIRFFDSVRESIGNPDKSEILVFGDGVYPDIHGGKIFGADTCLYDPENVKKTNEADYTVTSYDEALEIL